METLVLIKLLAACAVVTIGSMLQGTVGIGLGLVAVPILVLIDPSLVPGPVLFSTLVLAISMSYREHRAMDVSGIKWGLVGRLLGTLVAAAVLAHMSKTEHLALALGVLVLLAVVLSASGLYIRPTTWVFIGAGALSGFMGTASSIGGAPVALLYQKAPGARLRSTLSGFFIFGTTISLLALAVVGRFGRNELWLSLALLPGTLTGFGLSVRTLSFLERGHTRAAVLAISAVSGVVVILRELL